MITRQLQEIIQKRMFCGKAIILIGARQVGKSTLFRQLTQNLDKRVLSLNCDEPEVRNMLQDANMERLRLLIGKSEVIIIDEAQRVPGVGMTLKLITDNFAGVQLLVTGSSSLDLQNGLNESMTGRKYELHMFPISTKELVDTYGIIRTSQQLESRLIYGSYPDILNHGDDARELLMNMSGSYLYKDILSLDSVRRPVLMEKLLVALALQIGSEVSYNELAQTVGTDSKTVEKYIDLLEKCCVVFRLPALSRNVRTELKKGKKVYFYDNGIRNAILQNFSQVELRGDMGALWENFFISERLKLNSYTQSYAKTYFWRTTSKQEVDYVEEKDGVFSAFEMKWNPRKSSTLIPKVFLDAYSVKEKNIITPQNYLEYLLP